LLESLVEAVADALTRRGWMVATAESCTGGGVAKLLTDLPGSSRWFERGFVTYTNDAKREMLGVAPETLEQFGAVSEETVREMAEGACRHSHAQLTLAISGIAGPGGATPDKPLGTVYFAWAGESITTKSVREQFDGDREAVRAQAVERALQGLLDVIPRLD